MNFDPLYPEDEEKPYKFATFNGFITSRSAKAEIAARWMRYKPTSITPPWRAYSSD